MKALRVSILEKNEMLHALPWFLVIGMSLVVRLDPNLPSLSRVDPLSLFLLKSLGLALRIFPEEFCNISVTFQLLMQLSAWYWKWFHLVFLVRCIQLNHLEYTALFTTHLVYAHTLRKTCFGRERYVLLQGIVNMFLKKNVFNRFAHTFQKLG